MADAHNLSDELVAKLTAVVRDVLAPLIAADHGEIAWLGIQRGVAEIELAGACAGCPGQHFTLQSVVLPALRAVAPEIRNVRVRARVG